VTCSSPGKNADPHHDSVDLRASADGVKITAAEWDERYASAEQVWSGQPNAALVTEVTELKPGRALDVGCGEGADAVWLSSRGWDVTALDVSHVALERAAVHARNMSAQVQWMHAGLLEAPLPAGVFDLVSAQYPALLRTPDNDAERALLALVIPGGVLLVVHHGDVDVDVAKTHGFDPADYVNPSDVAALLDDDWQIEVDEKRPRPAPSGGAGAHHTHDVLLKARRLR
jgi:SAM-dependent methyltransferase